MTTSQAIMMWPRLTSLNLLTIAAMMSVPPMLPLWRKQKLRPMPSMMLPRTQAMNISSPTMRGS